MSSDDLSDLEAPEVKKDCDSIVFHDEKGSPDFQTDSFKFPEIDTEDIFSENHTMTEITDDGEESENYKMKSQDVIPIKDSEVYDAEESDIEDEDKLKNTVGKIPVFNSDVYDAEDSSDEDGDKLENQECQVSINEDSRINDCDGSADEESKENLNRKSDKKSEKKRSKNKVKTKEIKMDNELDEVHKESQRMVRESHISLPYHRPKQRTLSDFLNRRKSAPIVPLRTSNRDLAKVWKHLEEREKTVETFYKSESSSEEEVEDKVEDVEDNLKLDTSSSGGNKPVEDNISTLPPNETGCETKSNLECDLAHLGSGNVDETLEEGEVGHAEGSNSLNETNQTESCEASEINITKEIELSECQAEPKNASACLSTPSLDKSTVALDTSSKAPLSKRLSDLIASPLEFTPKLTADEGDFVQLDSDRKKKPGPMGLLDRFIKHVKLKPKSSPSQTSILFQDSSISKNISGPTSEVLSIEEEVKVKSKDVKPGQSLVKLKQSLKLSIEANRNQLVNSKIQQQQFYENEFCDLLGDEDSIDKDLPDEEIMSDGKEDCEQGMKDGSEDEEDEDNVSEEEECNDDDSISVRSKKKKKSNRGKEFLDEETIESDNDGSGDDEESDSSDESNDDSQDEEKQDDIQATSLGEKPVNLPIDKDDWMEEGGDYLSICSGQFQTQPIDLAQLETQTQKCSQLSTKKDNDLSDDSDEDFASSDDDKETKSDDKEMKVIESDDESIGDSHEVNKKSEKPKRPKKLVFSDDEEEKDEDVGNDTDEDIADNKDDEDNEEDIDGTDFINDEELSDNENPGDDGNKEEKVIDYNSEEEVVEGKKFLDVEAELSGSEWGSEDENEEGLSDFEADQADLEKIDQSKLRRDLERIHMKELLAEDKREVRLIKEMLFEDGDLHSDGPKRKRLFRWSTQGENISIQNLDIPKDEFNQDEELEDSEWRLQRIEREKFITDHLPQVDENIDLGPKVPTRGIDKKRNSLSKQNQNPNPEPASPDPKQPFNILTKRGSFLGRGEKVLSRLASLVQTDSNNSRVKRNMVFSLVSPPKEDSKPVEQDAMPASSEKRKAAEEIPKVTKKLKFTSVKKSNSIFEKLKRID